MYLVSIGIVFIHSDLTIEYLYLLSITKVVLQERKNLIQRRSDRPGLIAEQHWLL